MSVVSAVFTGATPNHCTKRPACIAVSFGDEPRTTTEGSFLLRAGDHLKKVEGLPPLPEKYRPYLMSEPIKAEIVKIGKTSLRTVDDGPTYTDTLVVLNVGYKQGVRRGMVFRVHYPVYATEVATVQSVTEDSCEALITQDPVTDGPPPTIGWRLFTVPRRWKGDPEVDDKPAQQMDAPDRE